MISRREVNVLLVEDESDLRAVIIDILQDVGYTCVGVSDVASARAHVASKLDVAIVDLHLPGEPPENLLEELRRGDVPVLLISADATEKSRAFARRWAAPLVIKPFELDDLIAQVERAAAGG